MIEKVNIAQKFSLFEDHWHPYLAAEFNGQQVRLAKITGEFTWHSHENEDEMFLVFRGIMRLQLRDQDFLVREGEFVIVPRGVEHCPASETKETWLVMVEPASTLNTGNVVNKFTHNETPPI
jgi:mannose-6-phosphate isomerase-like protein (cupin superfamily)